MVSFNFSSSLVSCSWMAYASSSFFWSSSVCSWQSAPTSIFLQSFSFLKNPVLYCPECGNRTTHATLPCPWTLASNFSFSISLLPGSSICSRRAVSTCCLLVYDCCNFLASSLMVSACVTTISVSIVWSDRVGSTFSLSRSPFSFSSS